MIRSSLSTPASRNLQYRRTPLLPDYGGRLFDGYRAHPEVLRLATRRQLEKGLSTEMSRTTAKAGLEKVRKIREAQAAGAVTKEIGAEHLLVLIQRLSMVQLDEGRLDRKSRETLRAGLVESIRRLVAP
jgi:hypothetical protein